MILSGDQGPPLETAPTGLSSSSSRSPSPEPVPRAPAPKRYGRLRRPVLRDTTRAPSTRQPISPKPVEIHEDQVGHDPRKDPAVSENEQERNIIHLTSLPLVDIYYSQGRRERREPDSDDFEKIWHLDFIIQTEEDVKRMSDGILLDLQDPIDPAFPLKYPELTPGPRASSQASSSASPQAPFHQDAPQSPRLTQLVDLIEFGDEEVVDTLESQDKLDAREIHNTMDQRAMSRGAAEKSSEPAYLGALGDALTEMLALAQSHVGRLSLQIEIGRILFHRPRSECTRIFPLDGWDALVNFTGPGGPLPAVFTNMYGPPNIRVPLM